MPLRSGRKGAGPRAALLVSGVTGAVVVDGEDVAVRLTQLEVHADPLLRCDVAVAPSVYLPACQQGTAMAVVHPSVGGIPGRTEEGQRRPVREGEAPRAEHEPGDGGVIIVVPSLISTTERYRSRAGLRSLARCEAFAYKDW